MNVDVWPETVRDGPSRHEAQRIKLKKNRIAELMKEAENSTKTKKSVFGFDFHTSHDKY